MVRYYGWYSNKMRGVRHRQLNRQLPRELIIRRSGIIADESFAFPTATSLGAERV
jgi:hypothetical protein